MLECLFPSSKQNNKQLLLYESPFTWLSECPSRSILNSSLQLLKKKPSCDLENTCSRLLLEEPKATRLQQSRLTLSRRQKEQGNFNWMSNQELSFDLFFFFFFFFFLNAFFLSFLSPLSSVITASALIKFLFLRLASKDGRLGWTPPVVLRS